MRVKKISQTSLAILLVFLGSLVPYFTSWVVEDGSTTEFIVAYSLWLFFAVLLGIVLGRWRALLLTPIPYLFLLLTTIVRGNMGELGLAAFLFGFLVIVVWFCGIAIGVFVKKRISPYL